MININAAFASAGEKIIRLLIVEDEYILARNLQEGLESLGYSIADIVDSAEAAIAQAAALHPDLILMDIRLRGEVDGISAAEQIWNQLQIPIIYLTGHSDQSTVERAALSSPFGYVLKPVREKELYVAIQTALNRYEREQFLSMVLQGIGDGVIVVDTHLQIKYLNQVAEILTGWTLDEVREKSVDEIIPIIDDQTHQPILNNLMYALENGEKICLTGKISLMRKDGGLLPISDSVAPLKNRNGMIIGAVLVFRDDTQRRLIEEHNLALERAKQMEIQLAELRQLNQLKDDFLATTSHELRSPLSGIKLSICLLENALQQQGVLKSDEREETKAIARYIDILHDQCDQELSLVNDLLDMRSLDARAYPLEPAPIHLRSWMPHVAESFQERAESQQQTFQIDIHPETPVLISDMTSLTRILSELLNNACKYTPANQCIQVLVQPSDEYSTLVSFDGHSASAHLDLRSLGRGSKVEDALSESLQIVVRNSGVLIAPDHLDRIFDPFYRIPNNDPWKHGGTGLGLALVKKLVEYLHGIIHVESDEQWTSFTVVLPIHLRVPELC